LRLLGQIGFANGVPCLADGRDQALAFVQRAQIVVELRMQQTAGDVVVKRIQATGQSGFDAVIEALPKLAENADGQQAGCFLLLSFMVWEWGLWLAREDFGRVDGGDGAVGPDDDDPGRADR